MPGQSVLDNLWLGTDGMLRRAGAARWRAPVTRASGRRERARAVLTELLGHCPDALLTAPAGSLSLSERQAVAIGRALLRDAEGADPRRGHLGARRRHPGPAVRRGAAADRRGRRGPVHLAPDGRGDRDRRPGHRAALRRVRRHPGPRRGDTRPPGRADDRRRAASSSPRRSPPRRPPWAASCSPMTASPCAPGRSSAWPASRARARTSTCGRCVAASGQDGTPVRVAYVARDRREESIFPPLSVRENFTAATLSPDARGGLISVRAARGEVRRLRRRGSRSGSAATTTRSPRCPAATSRRWSSPGPWPAIPGCCCSTTRPAASTSAPSATSTRCCASSPPPAWRSSCCPPRSTSTSS